MLQNSCADDLPPPPHQLEKLTALRSLFMQNNLVEEIPDLSSMPELTTLGLCNNNITSVGTGLTSCKKLNALNLSKNRLESLEAVEGLRSLTVTSLDLSTSSTTRAGVCDSGCPGAH